MKKILLMAAIMAGSISANAQMKIDNVNSIKSTMELATESSVSTRSTESTLYFFRPQGLFYTGWNKGFFNPGMAFCPANTPIFFSSFGDMAKPGWVYPTGKFDAEGKPETGEAYGTDLEINLPEGEFFCPILANPEDQNDYFQTAGALFSGGTTFTGTAEYQGEEVCNDGYAVNYVPEGNLGGVANFFCTANKEADATAGAQIFGDEMYKTLGFGEMFVPTATMYVKGFNTLCFAEPLSSSNISKMKPAFYSIDAEGMLVELTEKDAFDCEITELAAEGELRPYHLLFSLKGDPIKVEANMPLIAYYGPSRMQVTPFFDGQKQFDMDTHKAIGVTTAMVNASMSDGKGFLTLTGIAFTDQDGNNSCLNNWCIGLDMSYKENGFAGIDNVTVENEVEDGAVYNVAGVKVAENGNTENLPAGVYVMNGKKFVVK